MPEEVHGTIPMTRDGPDGTPSTGSGFVALAPDIQDGMYRRLAAVGIVYSGTWLINYLYYTLLIDHTIDPVWHVVSNLGIAFGLVVFFLSRQRRIPPRHFGSFASAFEIVGAIGIMGGMYAWEHRGAEFLERMASVVGVAPENILRDLVIPLTEADVRVLYHEGVTWVSVWMLAYTFLVPTSLVRTTVTTLLTAAMVPLCMAVSLVVHGIPETVRPWIGPYMLDHTVPVLICAGIAIASSRVIFRLTRELSDARRMGSYRLVEKIGEGGMGEVWQARHRMLARPAAIKLVRTGGDATPTEQAVRRFQQEAQATAELSSPHSIDLYDFGITDDGTFYYVMELLKGVDLRTLVDRHGPLPPERVVHVLRQTCHSLADAHDTGLIHRDIKPGNLFLCRSGSDFDFVKVLDFGLVKQIGGSGAETQLTMDGFAGGTPAFMAPEMARDENVDGRADLYALGCVGYWLLTGTLVFEGDTPVAVLARHIGEKPVPPSARSELPVPADLERLLLDCLEKDPEARPADARELARRLEACARDRPAWDGPRATEWWQIHLPQFCGPAHAAATPAVP